MTRSIDKFVVQYLKQVAGIMPVRPGHKYSSFEGFYLDKGHLYSHRPYTKSDSQAIMRGIVGAGGGSFNPKIKECFYNAQQLALSRPDTFSYAEGFAYPENLPIAVHHAWAVYKDKPVDVTLRVEHGDSTADPMKLLRRASLNLRRVAYYGVEFPTNMIWNVWQSERAARPMLDDPKHGFPLLKNPVKR